MILIALGANLPSRYGTPIDTLTAAREALQAAGVSVIGSSHIWLTAPIPFDPEQDMFHNAVISVETDLDAHDLLKAMLQVEEDFGRVRTVKNAARLLDLDLIAYNDEIIKDGERLIVPHPRMHERLFVLKPLEDVSDNWTHPISGLDVAKMCNDLPGEQDVKRLNNVEGWS